MFVLRLRGDVWDISVTGGNERGEGKVSNNETKRETTVEIYCESEPNENQQCMKIKNETILIAKETCNRKKHPYTMQKDNISYLNCVRR